MNPSTVNKNLIFDIGMYDGSDTEYYLDLGFDVVAVEANPNLANAATRRFADAIQAGKLTVVNAAIAEGVSDVQLTICGEDLGSSSILASWVEDRIPMGTYCVPAVNYAGLVEKFGTPYYLKIDIEGADGLCVKGVSTPFRPAMLSFEAGSDFIPLLHHLASVGYTEFKLISQVSFREASRVNLFSDRIRRKIMRTLGYSEPGYLRIRGRHFKVGHSSGPVPWESDGTWEGLKETLVKWQTIVDRNKPGLWFDLQAK